MANLNYNRGRRFEWELKRELEADGFLVTRASGSHGVFDLIALRERGGELHLPDIWLIQCKVSKSKKGIAQLIKDFEDTLPFSQSTFTQKLAIKITGERGFTYHIPE
jgi:Holliday junction resolvase